VRKKSRDKLPVKTRDFASDGEVRRLVAAFEKAAMRPEQFHHGAHMAVALSYLASMPEAEATARMRSSLKNFTAHHGINVYHETVTLFWMQLLHHLTLTTYRALPLWRRINSIANRYATVSPVKLHYSSRLLRTARARKQWVPPDRAPLAF
jgi:CDP-diacylglycerol--glycerol-3-phosphate 3-phosphatidyltransferase